MDMIGLPVAGGREGGRGREGDRWRKERRETDRWRKRGEGDFKQ